MSNLLPTRLLKYDEARKTVTLCTSVAVNKNYAALSHCWGSVQPLTLNTSTAQQLYSGISIETFPRTFQNALWVTHKLNFPYLWIDSLCIIQDSNDDWVRGSARMCDVYFMRPKSESFYTDITFLGGDTPINVSVFPMPNSHPAGVGQRVSCRNVEAQSLLRPLLACPRSRIEAKGPQYLFSAKLVLGFCESPSSLPLPRRVRKSGNSERRKGEFGKR